MTDEPISPKLIVQTDLAKYLGIAPRTVRLWEQTGKIGPLPVYKDVRTYYYRQEIDRWVEWGMPDRMTYELWLEESGLKPYNPYRLTYAHPYHRTGISRGARRDQAAEGEDGTDIDVHGGRGTDGGDAADHGGPSKP